jgi:hypothetical protein
VQALECMCHTVKDMLEDKPPSLTIHISVSTREADLLLIMLTQDLMSTAALTSHLQITLVHLQIPMVVYMQATFMN